MKLIENPPFDPGVSIGQWLREAGEDRVRLRSRVADLETELAKAQQSRHRFVTTMQELATCLGLPYPDPQKVLAAVRALKERHEPA